MVLAYLRAAVLVFAALFCFGAKRASADSKPADLQRDYYNWRNVAMGGGGYVTGLVAHPDVSDLIYIRTDVGGAYRYSAKPDDMGRNWIPLSDSFTADQWNYYGVESLAIDPNNPDILFMAAGKYAWAGKGRIFKSGDRGQTWAPLPLETPMAANGDNRHVGERLAVDPFNPGRIYFGSRTEGLWICDDGGWKWRKSGALPAEPDPTTGISFVLPDPYDRPRKGKPARVYIGLWGVGVAVSEDGGDSWSLLGGVVYPAHAALSKHGYLVVAGKDGVYRYDNQKWTEITPAKGKAFGSLSIDPFRPNTLIVAENAGEHQLPMYLSNDRGESWKVLSTASGSITAKADVQWWAPYMFASSPSSVNFDPQVKDRLWMTDWYGTWLTSDYGAPVPHFITRERGHEEMVVMTMISPNKDASLLSGTVDTNGFRHNSMDLYPDNSFTTGGLWQTFGMDFYEGDANRIIRVGTIGNHGDDIKGGVALSLDNGATFKALTWPYKEAMKVAYSSTNPNLFVVLPKDDMPKVSSDGGLSWQNSTGVEGSAIKTYWHWLHPLASDRVKGKIFYLYVDGRFYNSEDGGLTWTKQSDLPQSTTVFVDTAEGQAGWVFVALGKEGLFASHDGGRSFERLPEVKNAELFSTGKPSAYSDKPVLFLYGEVTGSSPHEILRSDDMGLSWKIISTPGLPIGDQPTIMRGDSQSFGRVFIGTNGRGIYAGTRR